MIYDRQITISTAGNRRSTKWPASTLMWSELVERLRLPTRGMESLAQYKALPKGKQDDLKDVGGFVGGVLAGERRKAAAVMGRDIITLDLDNIQPAGTQDALRRIESMNIGYCVYSTRKHEEAAPRLRVLFPLCRRATADEYEPIARKLASWIGMELCDPSTFEASRLMYFPSCSADSQYVYTYADKPMLDADGMLRLYADWRNVTEWPEVPGAAQTRQRLAAKQGDPTDKNGIVGAFCKIYDVYKAMDAFLPGEYAPCDNSPGRYTFTGGSTAGGAVIYDDGKFLYSHHATDPAGGRLSNAFDLVRLHLYSGLDDDALPNTPTNKLPSYAEMCKLAVSDTYVASLLNQERYEAATQEFAAPPPEDANWISRLEVSPTSGLPAKTTDNVLLILNNDPLLKDKIAYDEFANLGVVLGPLPWDQRGLRRRWEDFDDSGLRHYLEKTYRITGKDRIADACTLAARAHSFHDLRAFLTSQQWDGVKRLDTLLSDYLGAADTVYTRAVIRKSLCAAVARAMTPGVKYDYMPIITGPQGIGKSTFLRTLAHGWFSDSQQTFEGKEASELLQGVWIIEIGELSGFTKSETNTIKNFLSRTEDIYRAPFGRHTKAYPRQCVFFGTCNDSEFLRDRTGNRRFWPVDVGKYPPRRNIFTELAQEAPQIWAEAFVYWQWGERLFLTGEAENISKDEQEGHKEHNAKEGIIREFLDRPVPPDWDKRTLGERRLYWSDAYGQSRSETGGRTKVCAAEIFCECFGGDVRFMKRVDAIEINNIIAGFPEWRKMDKTLWFGKLYGAQKGFEKV